MAFKVYKGHTKDIQLPMTTSTAIAVNRLVEMTSGLVGEADADDTAIAGVLVKATAATDADYATARSVAVRVPVERHVVWEADGATFSSADIGLEFGISDSGTLDQTETIAKIFLVTEVVSATKVRGFLKINGAY